MASRCLQITWKVETTFIPPLVESLLLEAKKKALLNPVVVDLGQPVLLVPRPSHRDKSDELGKFYRTTGVGDIPWVDAEDFHLGTTDLIKRKQLSLLSGRDFILLSPLNQLPKTLTHVEDLWYLCEPDSSTASDIYGILDAFSKKSAHPPRIFISILGMPHVEKAAAEFLRIRDEVRNVRTIPFDLVFCGHMYADPEKMALAQAAQLPYIEVYERDSFHGQIKRGLTHVISGTSAIETLEAIKKARHGVYGTLQDKGHKAPVS